MDDSTIITLDSAESSSSSAAAPPLRRRNSIATTVVLPKHLSLPPPPRKRSSFHAPISPDETSDFELVSLKSSSYTSLKDLLPSSSTSTTVSINSPSIRNRLVKQAAWAYLQPMSASPSTTSGPSYFRHFFFRRLIPAINRILHRILRAICGQLIV